VKLFDRAGGEFGSAVSWHTHGAVRFKSLLSTDDLVFTLGATKGAALPIWVTEAGSHLDDSRVPGQTEAQQDDQVKWIVDTGAGLASHDRITRLSYYHVRQDTDISAPTCQAYPNPWDTALVTACGKRRPAWYTWCLAARQNDAACYDQSPGAASWASSRLDVFWRGTGDDEAIYRSTLGEVLLGNGLPDKAREELERAVALAPAHPQYDEIRWDLAQAYLCEAAQKRQLTQQRASSNISPEVLAQQIVDLQTHAQDYLEQIRKHEASREFQSFSSQPNLLATTSALTACVNRPRYDSDTALEAGGTP